MATMNDVARVAEVSIATVSHVINGTRYVSPERVERVHAAMRELDYTPDGTARSLRLGRTETLGLVVPDNGNPFFAELARGIEEAAFAAGYTTFLANSDERPERESQYIRTLLSKRVDGLIVVPSRADDGTLAELLGKADVPVVLVDREAAVGTADLVVHDNRRGGYDVARYLLDLGHTRLACVAGPPDLTPAVERLAGFRDALRDAGVALGDDAVAHGDFHFPGGREAAARLLERGASFTALFAANDLMAAGAIRELGDRGIAVPRDISVVGFDDAPLAEMIVPTLTTVRQPLEEMAEAAVSLLLGRLAKDGTATPVRRILPTRLVVRESAAPVDPRP